MMLLWVLQMILIYITLVGSKLPLQYSQEHARLHKLALSWQSLKQKISVENGLVEKTVAYWQTAPRKIVVTFVNNVLVSVKLFGIK